MKAFGYLYGAIISISYLVIKKFSGDMFVQYFSISCLLLSIVTLFFLEPRPEKLNGIIIRGVLYSTTNFILLFAQSKSNVSSSLTASLLGSSILGLPIILKNLSRLKNILIVTTLLLGALFLREGISTSYLAIISGLLQAGTFAIAGRVMRTNQSSVSWNLFLGFGITAIMGFAGMTITGTIGLFSEVKLINLSLICAVILLSQLSFFALYRKYPTDEASRFSLARIPWSYTLEMIMNQVIVPPGTLLGIIMICFASYAKRERRSKNRLINV